jgi:hypothetical protein
MQDIYFNSHIANAEIETQIDERACLNSLWKWQSQDLAVALPQYKAFILATPHSATTFRAGGCVPNSSPCPCPVTMVSRMWWGQHWLLFPGDPWLVFWCSWCSFGSAIRPRRPGFPHFRKSTLDSSDRERELAKELVCHWVYCEAWTELSVLLVYLAFLFPLSILLKYQLVSGLFDFCFEHFILTSNSDSQPWLHIKVTWEAFYS